MHSPETRKPPAAESWLDAFFEEYYRHRPVNATFIGVHDHDGLLPDLSDSGLGDLHAGVRGLLAAGAGLEGDPSADGGREHLQLDRRLAQGFLRIQDWELTSRHGVRGNPALHTGEAIFGVLSLFLNDFAAIGIRAEAAAQRMASVPRFLAQARDLVREAPRVWCDRARRECRGARAFFTHGLAAMDGLDPAMQSRLAKVASPAAHAFGEHESYLEGLPHPDSGDGDPAGYACGEEALALHLSQGHFLDMAPSELGGWARTELAGATDALRDGAKALGAREPDDALRALSEVHPSAERYYGRYGEIWEASRRLAEREDLLSWPEFPIRYVPRPRWSWAAAPHLYFLFYRSPPAFHRPPRHDYLVTPIEPDMPAAEQRRLLESNNDAVIKLNHVVHHGGIGHHVQNWHAFRSASRIGRIAAVDCASRIAMFCGGTMAEGWACYATDLMREHGFLTPLEELAELRSRTRMCARAVVDVELHTGAMSFEQASAFYMSQAGMSADGARREVVKNTMFPGGAIMYLAGTDAIHDLRSRLRRRDGDEFNLRDFHDTFLSYGSVPVSLIAQDMMERPQAGGGPSC